MKFPLILATLVATFFLSFTPAAQGQTLQQVFDDGVTLYNQKDYTAALQKFEQVLRAKPTYVYARNYIGKCKAAIASGAGQKNDTEAQIARILIPEINLTDAPIGDVLLYLSSRAEELTGGKLVPNFIYEGTSEQRQNTLISINLRNVPMTEAIRYIGQLSRSDFRYEAHAIVVTPRTSTISHSVPTLPTEAPGTVFGEPVKRVFD
ncbi:MAG: hypothetical protein P1U68_11935 [Verrucomicrobiales bacterium]|nr:hypothetical protein [Verrucomicrobiales bacterium]